MPEMPEVETIARKLRKNHCRQACCRQFAFPACRCASQSAKAFAEKLHGRTIRKIMRRGKYLIAETGSEGFLADPSGNERKDFVSCRPEAGSKAYACDGSVFGFHGTGVSGSSPVRTAGRLRGLAAQPDPGNPFSGKRSVKLRFRWQMARASAEEEPAGDQIVSSRSAQGRGARQYLCLRSLVSRANSPGAPLFYLGLGGDGSTCRAIRKVLRTAIRRRGTSFSDFVDSDGKPGDNQNLRMVFQRDGEKCVRCRTPIERLRQGNRSSFYCCRLPAERRRLTMTESYRKCSHCKGTGICHACHGAGRLALQKGKRALPATLMAAGNARTVAVLVASTRPAIRPEPHDD